jgi:cation diffusion facilitator family transporter
MIMAASRAGREGILPMEAESRRTVVVAMAANFGVAIAKLVTALVTGSSAMLAEAFHAVADTGNEALLLVAQWRGGKPADERHPLGHGREAYFWALIASLAVFVTGALLSLRQGVNQLMNPVETAHFPVAYVVLVVSFGFDGMSLFRVYRQIKGEAAILRRDFFEHFELTSDPIARAVFAEDTAALAGNLIALSGIALHQATGSTVPDAVAAIVIAMLLAYVAFELAKRNRDFIIGQQVSAPLKATVREIIAAQPGIVAVGELFVTFLGPRRVWVVARIDIDDGMSGVQVKEALRAAENELKQRSPYIARAYLMPSGV